MTAESDAVAVVVPAHNESAVLPACLNSLLAAARDCPAPVTVVVVLDDCSDDSAALAGQYGDDVHFIDVDERNVGAARAAGFGYAGAVLRSELDQTCYATTDADTQVPPDWLSRQLESGADVVFGVVSVSQWRHFPLEVADRYQRRFESDEPGHHHVHGANMAFRASVYWAVGGFAGLASGEDVDLAQRLEAAGHRVFWDDELSVATSDRSTGRAPGGFADHLAEVSGELSDDVTDEAS